MAKKKKDQTNYLDGYIPASYTPAINSQEIKQIPPYPDAGVEYAGFSKTMVNNQYRLNKQEPVVADKTMISTDSSIILYTPTSGKAFYLTDLIMQTQDAGIELIYLTDGVLAAAAGVLMTLRAYGPVTVASDPQTILHFSVPIKFVKDVRLTTSVSGNTIQFNAIGWIEDL